MINHKLISRAAKMESKMMDIPSGGSLEVVRTVKSFSCATRRLESCCMSMPMETSSLVIVQALIRIRYFVI